MHARGRKRLKGLPSTWIALNAIVVVVVVVVVVVAVAVAVAVAVVLIFALFVILIRRVSSFKFQ